MSEPVSQNGWPVLTSAPAPVPIRGTGFRPRVRRGDVAAIFADLIKLFDDRVEDVDTLDHPHDRADAVPAITGADGSEVFDDWAYAYRPIRGRLTGFSNHASGTAIDLNATQHPRGVQGTFTRSQTRILRTILSRYVDPQTGRCVIRWGQDYVHDPEHGRYVDGMHFEINADAAALSRVVDRLHRLDQAMPAPAPTKYAQMGELDMFLAAVPGPDKRVFLVTGTGKLPVPSDDVLVELRRCGVPDRGEVSVHTLNMFPTITQTPAQIAETLAIVKAMRAAPTVP